MQNPFGDAAHNLRLGFFKRCLRCSLIARADSGFNFLDESSDPANPAFVNLSAIRVTDDALFCRFMISHKAVPQNKCSNVGARYAQTRCQVKTFIKYSPFYNPVAANLIPILF
jgi:hypothetical protein